MTGETLFFAIALPVGFAVIGWLVNSHSSKIGEALKDQGESIGSLTERTKGIEVALVGLDGQNGMRGEMRAIGQEASEALRGVAEIKQHLHQVATPQQSQMKPSRRRKSA